MSASPAEMRPVLKAIAHERGLFVDDVEERSQRIAAKAEREKFARQKQEQREAYEDHLMDLGKDVA